MNPIIRNILAVLAGVAVGTIVNMGFIQLGGSMVSPPEGIDPSDMDSLKANMCTYSNQNISYFHF
jgi:hypothetical protein